MLTTNSLSRDPFKSLFLNHLEQQDCDSLQSKIKIIQQFTRELEELECNTENQSTMLTWISIASAFSAGATFPASIILAPLLGALVGGLAATSAAVVIGGSFLRHRSISPIIEKLKRYRIALNSSTPKDWAILWELAGSELFLESLWDASKGSINHKGQQGKLI